MKLRKDGSSRKLPRLSWTGARVSRASSLRRRFAKDCKPGDELRSSVEFPEHVAKGAVL